MGTEDASSSYEKANKMEAVLAGTILKNYSDEIANEIIGAQRSPIVNNTCANIGEYSTGGA